jgi:hypothetical protein
MRSSNPSPESSLLRSDALAFHTPTQSPAADHEVIRD